MVASCERAVNMRLLCQQVQQGLFQSSNHVPSQGNINGQQQTQPLHQQRMQPSCQTAYIGDCR
jgi:hypothetical protein